MFMPWGKHKGKDLNEVPLSYLGWVLEEANEVDDYLRQAIKNEIADRLELTERCED